MKHGHPNLANVQWKWILAILILLVLVHYAPPVFANLSPQYKQSPQTANIAKSGRAKRLDKMFQYLKDAKDEQSARYFEKTIWQLWFQSDNEVVSSMMQEIMKARRASDFPKALELLDVLILQYPDYSEGWNQRATIYYLMGNLEASLKDVAETLAREPRHFGALAGRATIRWMQGEKDLAKQSFNAAVEIHPYLSEQEFLSR